MHLPRVVCHQLPERCFRVNGRPMFLCARCLGLYLSMPIGFFLSFIFNLGLMFNKNQILLVGFIMCLPMAVDGTTQLLKFRESNNRLRLFTGILAGLFCGTAIHYILFKIYFN